MPLGRAPESQVPSSLKTHGTLRAPDPRRPLTLTGLDPAWTRRRPPAPGARVQVWGFGLRAAVRPDANAGGCGVLSRPTPTGSSQLRAARASGAISAPPAPPQLPAGLLPAPGAPTFTAAAQGPSVGCPALVARSLRFWGPQGGELVLGRLPPPGPAQTAD